MKYFLSLLLVCATVSVFALNPLREYKVKPEKFGMQYKEEKVPTKDGATLNAWIFELPKKTTNWMVISSGGDGNMADNLEIASQFMSAGWNVVMYDYRGYGSSSDFEIDPDLYIYPQFVTDLNSVLDYLRKTRAVTKFDLYGNNIGAGLSVGVGSNRPEARKIIADGPWTSLEQMKKKIKSVKNKDVNLPFGYDKNHEPLFACGQSRSNLHVMFIVSPQDELIKPSDLSALKCAENTYIVKDSPSNSENFNTNKNVYFERIAKFLNS